MRNLEQLIEAQRAYFERGLEIFTQLSRVLTDPDVKGSRTARKAAAPQDDDAAETPKAELQRKESKLDKKSSNLLDFDMPSAPAVSSPSPAAAATSSSATPTPTPKPKPPVATPQGAPVAAPKPETAPRPGPPKPEAAPKPVATGKTPPVSLTFASFVTDQAVFSLTFSQLVPNQLWTREKRGLECMPSQLKTGTSCHS